MSMGEAMEYAPTTLPAARCCGAREVFVLALFMSGLVQGREARAADQSTDVVGNLRPLVGGKPLPSAFEPQSRQSQSALPADVEPRTIDQFGAVSPTQIRPSFQAQAPIVASPWQRLADYQAQGRVQVLTLWQSPSNMVSLQAGKHGGPSLQWSSRVMNRGGTTRGLLDRFVASSFGAGSSSKFVHSASAASKTIVVAPAAKSP